ncbi:DNA-processing protein DprA [Oscillatoria salina]|uniref:DNA-processing protein DprA n=1 Tax=Oscillatoria salina TaxID=331517 RepID=UPI0013BCBF9E|nr:DNA-processing protein DprA [Oscillatoria salina]MBZ8179834.1 DNA-protecting protein DprA [Oscillatoria salina IIICB1]NET88095.1 DNA-protecting protein DprA [Kamptonema sp. SIO1D9]
MVEERAYWLAWSQVPKVGSVLLQRLYQHFGTLQKAWLASEYELRAVEGLGGKTLSIIVAKRNSLNPEQLLSQHLVKNPNFWTPADQDYPYLLREIPSPPGLLYYRGEVNRQENQGITPMVGIVGTRYPTEHGRRWTRKISAALAKHGFTVVSGMAAGIDTEAHQGCLEAGGRTIAVLGTGVDIIYPSSNRKLYEQIQNKGLIVSEYVAGTTPNARNFPPRNRIIAGLCRAVLVMEAPQKSGALITARYANEFGRDIYVLPNSPDREEYRGCLKLLNRGAFGIEGEAELLEMLGTIPQLDVIVEPQQPIPELELSLAKVLSTIASEAMPFDLIVQAVNMDSSAVSAALLELELMGLISQLPGMRYRRN